METAPPFAILLGGALDVDERVRAHFAGARVIAADSGIRHAASLGLTPELWVGDFDSVSPAESENWRHVPRRFFPPAKNSTDGELAIDEAIARGAGRLILAGALKGERTDHAALHFLQAIELTERGLPTLLLSGEEEAVPLLPGRLRLDLPPGSLFSILPFTPLAGLTLRGVRYPLDRARIGFASSRTMSNVAEGAVDIELDEGRAVMVVRPNDFSGI